MVLGSFAISIKFIKNDLAVLRGSPADARACKNKTTVFPLQEKIPSACKPGAALRVTAPYEAV